MEDSGNLFSDAVAWLSIEANQGLTLVIIAILGAIGTFLAWFFGLFKRKPDPPPVVVQQPPPIVPGSAGTITLTLEAYEARIQVHAQNCRHLRYLPPRPFPRRSGAGRTRSRLRSRYRAVTPRSPHHPVIARSSPPPSGRYREDSAGNGFAAPPPQPSPTRGEGARVARAVTLSPFPPRGGG